MPCASLQRPFQQGANLVEFNSDRKARSSLLRKMTVAAHHLSRFFGAPLDRSLPLFGHLSTLLDGMLCIST